MALPRQQPVCLWLAQRQIGGGKVSGQIKRPRQQLRSSCQPGGRSATQGAVGQQRQPPQIAELRCRRTLCQQVQPGCGQRSCRLQRKTVGGQRQFWQGQIGPLLPVHLCLSINAVTHQRHHPRIGKTKASRQKAEIGGDSGLRGGGGMGYGAAALQRQQPAAEPGAVQVRQADRPLPLRPFGGIELQGDAGIGHFGRRTGQRQHHRSTAGCGDPARQVGAVGQTIGIEAQAATQRDRPGVQRKRRQVQRAIGQPRPIG